MKKNYYVVKQGRQIGIFKTWEECQIHTDGFQNAIYAGFKTLEEAEAFLHDDSVPEKILTNELTNEMINEIIDKSDEFTANAFVDGSRDFEITKYSYGVLILYKKTAEIKKISLYKSMIDKEGLALHQFAGEIKAAMIAITWAIDQNFKKINIFYDYEGIEKFATGEYKKTNNIVSANYVKFINLISAKISIVFHKVKAHSGIILNEEADALANRALHEAGFRTYRDGSFLVFGLSIEDWESVINSLNVRLESTNILIDKSIIKDRVERLKIHNGPESVSIQVYGKSKSYIQGKPSTLLEHLILESVSYLKNPEDLREHLNRYYALQIENEQIYVLGGNKLPNIRIETLNPKIKLVFECLLYNYLVTSNMPEYTSMVSPAFRISEFYLHYILGNCLGNATSTPDGKNNFAYFSKSGGYYIYNRSKVGYSIEQIEALNELYNFYNKTRHIYSHWGSTDFDSNIVSTGKEARDILDESFVLFDKCHSLFYT